MVELLKMIPDIPHGHGLSFKKGICKGLIESEDFIEKDLPNGHEKTFKLGIEFGRALKKAVGEHVLPNT